MRQTTITSPSQLIDAVNGLRASYGLSPLTVHSALMQSAQSQADYMAATGTGDTLAPRRYHLYPAIVRSRLSTGGRPFCRRASLGEYFEQRQSAGVEWRPACLAGCASHGHDDHRELHPYRRGHFAGFERLLLRGGLCRRNRFGRNAGRSRGSPHQCAGLGGKRRQPVHCAGGGQHGPFPMEMFITFCNTDKPCGASPSNMEQLSRQFKP